MFTGIIEEVGIVKRMEHVSDQAVKLEIGSDNVIADISTGDSIAVNGICLTVTDFTSEHFQVDAMPETITSTSLNALTLGSKVNLERAMAADGRFGGHFVSGHVDDTGRIIRKEKQENAVYYDIQIAKELTPLFIKKGSVAVDGISLTIFHVEKHTFTISLIPHTVSETTLGEKREGDIVNIECDMLAKYIQQMLKQQDNREI
ncbi:riboflavin synthase [Virgibacillus sp. NKC19-3]|uniref:riboflavin synthase n=1 Tax=Virgibacillus saliphilus TaxID=2831674 RepID=UPI001C9B6DDE|nr:riboflavin synthase [Virgibacillus sp. NKC19-3]MBY7142705.1 riboflavin synthase [Virgibacillus sp. NKC19-3]